MLKFVEYFPKAARFGRAVQFRVCVSKALNVQDRSATYNGESPPAWRRAKRGQQTKGVSRAGISTKVHLAITTSGQVVEGFLSGGNVNDIEAAPALVEDLVGCVVIAERGYDSDKFRRLVRGNNNVPVIPGRKRCIRNRD